MTRSDRHSERAGELLRRMSVLLDEERVAERIDEPIDEAVRSFPLPDSRRFDHGRFHDVLARFVRHLYRSSYGAGKDLTPTEAQDEAVALLEGMYDGEHGPGCDGAVADAADPDGPGMGYVLLSVAELLKRRGRASYRRWVATRYLDPADWPTRCAAAELLLRWCRPWLPATARDWPPERWADHVFVLLDLDLATELTPSAVFAEA